MLQAEKMGEVIDPRQISLFGPEAIVKITNFLALLILKLG